MTELEEETLGDRLAKIVIGVSIAVFAFVVGYVVTFASVALLALLGLANTTVAVAASVVMFQGVTFGGVALLYLRIRGYGISFVKARVPRLIDVVWIVVGFIALIAVAFGVSQLLAASGVESAQNQIQTQGEQSPVIFLLLIPLSFLLIGPGEELLFRGLIQGTLRESWGAVFAVGFTSLVFAVLHVFALTGGGSKLVYLGVVFLLSLILGSSYELSDNIVVPSTIHGGYNALLFGSMYIQSTGMAPGLV